MVWIMGLLVALGIGVYVGLGFPGLKGRQDRIVTPGRAHRLRYRNLDWFRTTPRR